MRFNRLPMSPLLLPLAGFAVAGPAQAQESFNDYFWARRVTTGLDYTAGKYGETTTTEIAFVPVSAQAARGPWTFKVSGGWLSVSGPALILDGAATGGAAASPNRKDSGFADTSLSAMYSLERLYDKGVYIDLTARVKLPTASYGKGLGTGEGDLALQVDGAFAWDHVMPFVTLGYKFNGSPANLPLRDVWFGSLGVQYNWNEKVTTGVAFDYRQSSLKTSSDPQEGTVYLNVRFTEEWSFNLYGLTGFSQNSPGAGGGITFTYRLKPG